MRCNISRCRRPAVWQVGFHIVGSPTTRGLSNLVVCSECREGLVVADIFTPADMEQTAATLYKQFGFLPDMEALELEFREIVGTPIDVERESW